VRTSGILQNEKGIALMLVLWVLVLLSILALNHLSSTRWNTASTRNMKEEALARYIALSGYNEAVHYLMSDKDTSFDYNDTAGNYRADAETPTVTGKRTTPEGEVEIQITDEDSKININQATQETLQSLFTHAGVAEDRIAEVVDSILDWKDPSRAGHRLSGADDSYYEGLPDPYKAKHGPFDVPEELLLVKGIKPEYLYGGKDIKPILPLITTFGTGALNINTVSSDFMSLMGLNNYEIEAVLKQRNEETGGFRVIPQQFAARGFHSMASSNLRIEVSGRAGNSTLLSRIVAVVKREPAGKGFKVRTIYWREHAENSRG
jgi:general secretion pathway protein K